MPNPRIVSLCGAMPFLKIGTRQASRGRRKLNGEAGVAGGEFGDLVEASDFLGEPNAFLTAEFAERAQTGCFERAEAFRQRGSRSWHRAKGLSHLEIASRDPAISFSGREPTSALRIANSAARKARRSSARANSAIRFRDATTTRPGRDVVT